MLKARFMLFVCSIVILAGCKEQAPIPEPESRPVKLASVAIGNSELIRKFPAIVQAGDKAILTFRVSGQVATLNVKAGDVVQKGQVLAELNPDEYQLLQKQAKANFELANVQYLRMKKLRKDQVVSEQDYDKAVASYKSANANLEQATANLRYTKLIAPYDGTVSITNFENFEFVNSGEPVMNIQTTEILKIEFQLPGYLLPRFIQAESKKAMVTLDSFPDESFPVQFLEIDTESDSKTNSFKTTMLMNRPDNVGVLPGMSGQLNVSMPQSDLTELPKTAVFSEGDAQYVWRVNSDSRTEKIPVILSSTGQLEFGLNDGDIVVASGVSSIEQGMKVREWVKEQGL